MLNLKRFAWLAVALVLAFAGSALAGDLANSVVVFDWDLGSEDDGGFKLYDGVASRSGAITAGANNEVEIFIFPVIANPNPVTGADGIATHVLPTNLIAIQGSLAIDKAAFVLNRFRWDADLSDDTLLDPTGQTVGAPLLTPEDPESQILLTFFRDTPDGQATGHPVPYGYAGTMRLNAVAAVAADQEVVIEWDNLSVTSAATPDDDPGTDTVGVAVDPVLSASSGQVQLGGSTTVSVGKFVGALRINGTVDESMIDWVITKTGGADVSVEGQTGLTFSKSVTEPSIVLNSSGSGAATVTVNATIGGTALTAASVVFQDANPVELASFAGELMEEQVRLNWTTASQTNNAGWRILRSHDGENYEAVGSFVDGAGTTDELMSYSFSDDGLPQVDKLYYVLEQIDLDGTVHLSNPIEVLLGARFQDLPQEFGISAYPNPFNPSTTISYDLPSDELVSIVIYDVLGQEVRRLIDDQKAAGRYSIQWDARDNGGRSVATGVYIAKIEAGTFSQSQKMLLLK